MKFPQGPVLQERWFGQHTEGAVQSLEGVPDETRFGCRSQRRKVDITLVDGEAGLRMVSGDGAQPKHIDA